MLELSYRRYAHNFKPQNGHSGVHAERLEYSCNLNYRKSVVKRKLMLRRSLFVAPDCLILMGLTERVLPFVGGC